MNQSESRPNVLFALLLFNDDDDESAEIRRPLAVDVAAYHVVTPAVQSSGRPSVRGVASSTCCHYTRIHHHVFSNKTHTKVRRVNVWMACGEKSEGENECVVELLVASIDFDCVHQCYCMYV